MQTQPQAQPVAGNLGSLQALLEKYKGQIAVALPGHLTAERMIRVALTAVGSTPGLQKCSALSIAGCVVQASILGLEPNSVLGEAYLVPYGTTCQLIPGYMGLLKLVRNSGELIMINAQPVHAKDTFDFEDGLDPYLKHKRAGGTPEDRGPVVSYWAGAVLKGGGKQFVVMTKPEVEAHGKKYSKAFNNGPWKTEFDAMALKTCIRKLCKLLPKSIEKVQIAVSLDERHEAGIGQQFSVDIPIELQAATEVEPDAVALVMPQRITEADVNAALAAKNAAKGPAPATSDYPDFASAPDPMEVGFGATIKIGGKPFTPNPDCSAWNEVK